MVAPPQKRSAEASNDAGAKKVKFDKSSPFKKSHGGKFEGKKTFGKPGLLSINCTEFNATAI